ncbi:unnamed protein product [Paramecium sonneborni]|uniref:Uncharacterized protein n=1 Tax=Paramecium sonneborni TaxID=65129 RepID=A0A8S1LRW7_9CILI|nr:unnamed protein product [Paramecium sonneborni]
MLFEQYKDYEYNLKKMEFQLKYHTLKTFFEKVLSLYLNFGIFANFERRRQQTKIGKSEIYCLTQQNTDFLIEVNKKIL